MDNNQHAITMHVSLTITWPENGNQIRHKINADLTLVPEAGGYQIKKDAAEFSGGDHNWVEGHGARVLDAITDWLANLSHSFRYRPAYYEKPSDTPSA